MKTFLTIAAYLALVNPAFCQTSQEQSEKRCDEVVRVLKAKGLIVTATEYLQCVAAEKERIERPARQAAARAAARKGEAAVARMEEAAKKERLVKWCSDARARGVDMSAYGNCPRPEKQ
jgi:hypothetical protein